MISLAAKLNLLINTEAKLFYEAMFFVIIITYLLNRLVPCHKCMKLASWVLQASLDQDKVGRWSKNVFEGG